jgi:hypothetical protein
VVLTWVLNWVVKGAELLVPSRVLGLLSGRRSRTGAAKTNRRFAVAMFYRGFY